LGISQNKEAKDQCSKHYKALKTEIKEHKEDGKTFYVHGSVELTL
jgi:hypothetical protein